MDKIVSCRSCVHVTKHPLSHHGRPIRTSRWIPTTCTGDTIQADTNQLFAGLLRASTDNQNAFVRDITFPLRGVSCNAGDRDKFDFKVDVGGECWLNVHQSHLQVFDFTAWVGEHPGGANPITQFSGGPFLKFPSWHGMDRWYGESRDFRSEVGRYGDEIRFDDLPMDLATEDVATELGANEVVQAFGPAVVCGSTHEVRNDPTTAGKVRTPRRM